MTKTDNKKVVNLNDLKTNAKKTNIGKIHEVPWQGKIFRVKQLTTRDILMCGDMDELPEHMKMGIILVHALVDENGDRMFSSDQEKELMELLPQNVFNDIIFKAMGHDKGNPEPTPIE